MINRINQARKQKVIVEFHSGDWLVMFNDGRIQPFGTPAAALHAVQADAKRGNRTITVTHIEWRNTPDGFVPPTPKEE